jgi:hypothetical protein
MALRLMRMITLFALATGLSVPVWAEVYKCIDASGRVTYSDIACLQSQEAGAVVTAGGAAHRSSPTAKGNPDAQNPCKRTHPSGTLGELEDCRQQPAAFSSVRR